MRRDAGARPVLPADDAILTGAPVRLHLVVFVTISAQFLLEEQLTGRSAFVTPCLRWYAPTILFRFFASALDSLVTRGTAYLESRAHDDAVDSLSLGFFFHEVHLLRNHVEFPGHEITARAEVHIGRHHERIVPGKRLKPFTGAGRGVLHSLIGSRARVGPRGSNRRKRESSKCDTENVSASIKRE